jgi:hypothetical protein
MEWNANGLQHHQQELQAVLDTKKEDVCLVSETHFTRQSHIKFRDYKVQRCIQKFQDSTYKKFFVTLDVKFLNHLQSTQLFHEYSGPSISAMLGSIPGSPFLELYQVPAALPIESLQWCRIFEPSSEASA